MIPVTQGTLIDKTGLEWATGSRRISAEGLARPHFRTRKGFRRLARSKAPTEYRQANQTFQKANTIIKNMQRPGPKHQNLRIVLFCSLL